ncbi:MAG: ribokinase [Deltaproteobacteria bacterium]|nr:MAG: ribokinase [Deltaproteobacteria bacterium]
MNHTFSAERTSVSPSGFDVCVIGHITRDIIRVGRTTKATHGGTAYYTSIALKRLGLRVAVVTGVAKEDKIPLLRDLRAETIAIFCKKSEATSVFENTYDGEDLDARIQRIESIATPFLPEDVARISATAFHLGPLTRQDIPLQILKQLTAKARIVSLDVQGMVRPARVGVVSEEDWPEKQKGLACVDILKTDEKESLILSGQKVVDRAAEVLASLGPKEVIITMGSRGALIYAEQTLHRVGCCPLRKTGYPTGSGDTYMAGYLYQRLKGTAPERAGRFAAAVASLKMKHLGPFRGREEDVQAVLFCR